MTRAAAALCGLCALLHGCGDTGSPDDARARARLEGRWTYEFRDTHERPVVGTLTLAPSGVFSGTEQRQGEAEEASSGEWFVTAGLFKLKTTRSQGRPLGSFQMLFFTCRLVVLERSVFDCLDQRAGITYRFRRVAA